MTLLMFFIECAFKSVLITVGLLLVLSALRHRSAAEKAATAHAGLLVILFLPLWVAFAPHLYIRIPGLPVPWGETPIAHVVEPLRQGVHDGGESLLRLILLLYGAPLLFHASKLAITIRGLGTLRKNSSNFVDRVWHDELRRLMLKMKLDGHVELKISDKIRSPVSWGLIRPVILLDCFTATDTIKAKAVLAHELGHIARKDWFGLLLSRSVTALFWFNPFVWLLARRAAQYVEQAADDLVLDCGAKGSDYAQLLVDLARHGQQGSGAALGINNHLNLRVIALLDQNRDRRAMDTWRRIAAGIFILSATAACGSVNMAGTQAHATLSSSMQKNPAETQIGSSNSTPVPAISQSETSTRQVENGSGRRESNTPVCDQMCLASAVTGALANENGMNDAVAGAVALPASARSPPN